MKNFLKFFSIIFIISESSFIFWIFFDNEISSHELFLYEFFLIMYLTYYLEDEENEQKLLKIDIDFLSRFFILFFKTPSFFFNYFINIFKKVYTFLLFYKYRQFIIYMKIILRKMFYNFFVIWRPLFKKTSYFGYYRSNRSKWIK